MASLHTAYRPRKLSEVVGQGAAVKALAGMIKRGKSHCFLFTGPSGTGKTTLARIAAAELGCKGAGLLQVDAATNSGIDAMRAIVEMSRYTPFSTTDGRAIIIDEAHGLSRQAWDAILMATEEPPAHVYWFFCTTNPTKVPTTIKTRCTTLPLKEVSEKDLGTLLDEVCEAEKIELAAGVADLIIKEARGSPRMLLTNLETCQDCETKKGAADLLRSAIDSDAMLELCRYVAAGNGSWAKAMVLIERLEGAAPESCRIQMMNYLGSVMRNAKTDKAAINAMRLLEAFETPYQTSENLAPLMLSVGRALFSQGD